MITLLTGDNSFEIDRELKRLVAEFDGRAEKIDGSELELRQLPDLLMGTSLFADKRLVIIKNLSENKTVWSDFADWLGQVSDDIHLVLVDPKPDKRTRTYKELQKVAELKDLKIWGERDTALAEKWVSEEAKRDGLTLDQTFIRALVARGGVDQWRLHHALEKVAMLENPAVEDVIELHPSESVFQLFETALKGRAEDVRIMVQTLERTEDAYKTFGLISSQAFQLAALASSEKSSGDVAKDFDAHPFVLSKLSSHARTLGRPGTSKVIAVLVEADDAMKSSASAPWMLVERALIKIANQI